MAWRAGCRRGPPDVGAVATLSSPSSTAPSFGCCPRKACRLSPSDGQPSLWLHGCPSSRDVRAPAGQRRQRQVPSHSASPLCFTPHRFRTLGAVGSLSVLTEELDGRVPHGPARRAQAPQRQGHHGCGVAQHGPAQPCPTDQRLQHVEGTHLARAQRAQWHHVRGKGWEKTGQPRGHQLPGCWAGQHDQGCGFWLTLSSHGLTLGTWHSSLHRTLPITLFPKGLQQPGAPHSPAGGRGSGPSPVAEPWWPRPAVSGCSGSGVAVPAPGPPR